MKSLFGKLALVLLVASASAAAYAQQTQNVVYGRTTITMSQTFLNSLVRSGATLTDLSGNTVTSAGNTFTAVAGALNTSSKAGEIFHTGGYVLAGAGQTVRVQDFDIDTTNTSRPVISALFVVNDTVYGRVVLFDLQATSSFMFTAMPGSGVANLSGITMSIDAAGANALNSIFGGPVTSAGTAVGTETQFVVLAATPTGSQ